jgi:uncharacterized repeat protein (TIGR01451 family)
MFNLKMILTSGILMTSGIAAHASGVQLTNAVFKEVTAKSTAGKVETKLVLAGVVVPGDKVLFVMEYKNAGAKPAGNVLITNPVPSEVQYVGAKEGGEPVVSIDSGKNFAALTTLTVRNADGSTRPARASDVTHVRWQITKAMPGETGRVSFRGQLK